MSKRVKAGVVEFTGKSDYEFGDVSKELEKRRKKWAEGFLGKEGAENYEFGDASITASILR